MKVIFLDIDGVLNYEEFYTRHTQGKERRSTYPLSEICRRAVANVNRIVDATGAKIVISSTWRHSGIDYCRNVLVESGLTGEIIDITPELGRAGSWVERGNEILKWLQDNKLYKYDSYMTIDHDYAIIDDDSDMLYQQRHNFFECSPKTGLTVELADKVIEFLNYPDEGRDTKDNVGQ